MISVLLFCRTVAGVVDSVPLICHDVCEIYVLPAIVIGENNVIERFSVVEEFGLFDPGVVFERLHWPNDSAGEVEAIERSPVQLRREFGGNWNCSLVPMVGLGSIHAVEASLSSSV